MNRPIKLDDLPRLQDYMSRREDFRARTLAEKKNRYLAIGDNVSLLFENRQTVLYQVMEMLRIEQTVAAQSIQEELDAYNPLIPDGSNWKVTMLIEFPDEEERRVQLKTLRNVEHCVWCEVGGQRITAIADEDMDRSDDEKTSAVHFLRFQLNGELRDAVLAGAELRFGIEHDRYHYASEPVTGACRDALLGDLGSVH